MSEIAELNFRENYAYKYFDIYSAVKNFKTECCKSESEVFYEIEKEKFRFGSIGFDVTFRSGLCRCANY